MKLYVLGLWVRNPAFGLLQIGHKLEKWQRRHNFPTWHHRQFFLTLFPLSSLVTGPSFMSISSLFLELWQFSFISDWPEIQKRKYPRLSFAQNLGRGWVKDTKVGTNVSNKMLHMLQNARVTVFIIYELLRKNQQEKGDVNLTPSPFPPTQIKVQLLKLQGLKYNYWPKKAH